MHVSEMMRTDLVKVPPGETFEKLLVMEACMPMRQIYVVDEGGKMLGMITSYDLLAPMAPFYIDSNLVKALPDDASVIRHAYNANAHKTAADLMVTDVASLKPSGTFLEADILIREKGGNVLPVVDDDGRLVGEITRKVILKYIALNVLGLGSGGEGR
ncbi:MAG: HPP family protein [Thermodesulfobacteriota bacterium]